jgi:endonuclease/exonuclease/phosphatase family metal-dependent hydrolase
MKYRTLLLMILLCPIHMLLAKSKPEVWMTYNMQNFFDDKTQGSEYNGMQWSPAIAQQKLLSMSQVFSDVATYKGKLTLIFLQEVENEDWVYRLIRETPALKGMKVYFQRGYYKNGQPQATGLAILSRYPVMQQSIIQGERYGRSVTRPIMMLHLLVHGQPLTAINVHLPSQIKDSHQEQRHAMIQDILQRLNQSEHPMIVAGDFNDEMQTYLPETWRDLWCDVSASMVPGSYKHSGSWHKIDHILLSSHFFDRQDIEYMQGSFMPYTGHDIMTYDPTRQAAKAFDSKTMQGFSDHLALVCQMSY